MSGLIKPLRGGGFQYFLINVTSAQRYCIFKDGCNRRTGLHIILGGYL